MYPFRFSRGYLAKYSKGSYFNVGHLIRDMHAIGNVTDRNLAGRPAGKKRLENSSAELAMQPAHPECHGRSTLGQISHIEQFVRTILVLPSQRPERGRGDQSFTLRAFQAKEVFAQHAGREPIEPGCNLPLPAASGRGAAHG